LFNGKLKEWGYKGIVVSDCGAIDDFWSWTGHRTHTDAAHASADAVLKGTTLECGNSYAKLIDATKSGLVSEANITRAVKKLFYERFKLGIFDPPDSVPFTKLPLSVVQSPEHAAHALKVARESIVLLQNNGTLPLAPGKRVLVTGPNADNIEMLWGNYHGWNTPASKTVLDGLKAKSSLIVNYTEGCDHVSATSVSIDLWENIKSTVLGRQVTGFTGSFYTNSRLSGQPSVVKVIPRLRWHDGGEASIAGGNFPYEHYSARFVANFTAPRTETLEIKTRWMYGLRFTFGNLLHFDWFGADADYGPDEDWRALSDTSRVQVVAGVTYPITVDYFHGSNEAILNVQITRPQTNDLASIQAKAADADVIVFVGGITPSLEGEEMPVNAEGFSGGDRTLIELPKVQRDLLEQLKKLGRPVVFVICSGSALAFNKTGLSAVVDAFYPGEAGGTAVADVLTGEYNPAGRLPVTFYSATTELPDFSNYDMSAGKGRTYRYYKGTPLYPFGHGLSYTSFAYSNLQVRGNALLGESVHVTFGVRNTGTRAGDEVIQVYVSTGLTAEPIKALKYFKRQNFPAGAAETKFEVLLPPSAFESFDDSSGKTRIVAGKYKISVGGSSADSALLTQEIEFTPTLRIEQAGPE
jgi:beta-glucosidase